MFVNCADIAIFADDNNIMEETTFTSSTSDLTTTTTTTTTQAGILSCSTGILMCEGQSLDDEHFCNEHCRKSTASCTPMRCKCQCRPIECKAIGAFEGQTAIWTRVVKQLAPLLLTSAERQTVTFVSADQQSSILDDHVQCRFFKHRY